MRAASALRWLLVALLACDASPAAAQDWHAEWQKTVEAANAEGNLVLYSQPNQDARDFILREFPKAYPKIAVSLSVLDTSEFVARIRTERSTGKYLWDLALAGPPGGFILEHDGTLDPVLPEFIDPELRNPDLWGGWRDAFLDNAGTYVFAMAKFIAGPWYDALRIPPEKVPARGLKLLLDPNLKGKIAWHDPVLPGSGTSYAYLIRVKLGDDGLKQLILDQKVDFVPQQFQVVDAVARGTAWIGIGPPVRSLMGPYTKAGVKTDMRSFGTSPDNNLEAIGGGALYVFKDRPHPNATKVFINWLLSKDVQYGMAKATDQASRRVDVPITTLPDETPVKGADYVVPQREDIAPAVRQTVQLISEWRKSTR
ncbi:MAG TPA: extracellular solute-binding protein [Stellaceae bacterium]|jgi:iron(III) transport system substrate-binding protein